MILSQLWLGLQENIQHYIQVFTLNLSQTCKETQTKSFWQFHGITQPYKSPSMLQPNTSGHFIWWSHCLNYLWWQQQWTRFNSWLKWTLGIIKLQTLSQLHPICSRCNQWIVVAVSWYPEAGTIPRQLACQSWNGFRSKGPEPAKGSLECLNLGIILELLRTEPASFVIEKNSNKPGA